MNEDFLQYLWRTRRFSQSQLTTTSGESVEVAYPGDHNTHAGPDFLNARVRIGGILWAGSVEVHVNSSDWLKHRHEENPAYGNVVLHVVYEDDHPIRRSDGTLLPCFELKPHIQPDIVGKYKKLQSNDYWIPCQHYFPAVPQTIKQLWFDRLLVERLEGKTEAIKRVFEANNHDWGETFYQVLARTFGLKINADPFEALARSLPQSILARHRDNPVQVEALLFGQAGMLSDRVFVDPFPQQLQQEYQYLQKKYSLVPLDSHVWKFFRLHPNNFPTIRIAQFAKLVQNSANLFSQIVEIDDIGLLKQVFQVKLDGYWESHFNFDKPAPAKAKTMGKTTIGLLIINAVVPVLFYYGAYLKAESLKERAIKILEGLPPEGNFIIEGWARLGCEAGDALQSQALLQLKNVYCDKKQCLRCGIGAAILR